MIMVIGGACQGKLDWALENIEGAGEATWVEGATCTEEELMKAGGVKHFHEFIRRMLKEEGIEKVKGLAEKIIRENPGIIIESTEVGYGLVPIDAFEREYREQVGRTCTELAAYSQQVVRVVMGIGTRIK